MELLEGYIAGTPLLDLIGKFHDPVRALAFLKKQKADVVFLDIHLPKIKGFEFIKLLPCPAQVIITTAYNKYGVESYEFEIVDYLLKPIEFDRFTKAVNKLKIPAIETKEKNNGDGEFIFFNVNKKRVKVFYRDVLFIESIKGYIRIYLENGESVLTKTSISKAETILPKDFLRIHKSFIVQLNKIISFSATKIELNGCTLPIGRMYQKNVGGVLRDYC